MADLYKYGVAVHLYKPIIKRGVVDFAVSADWTPSAGDVKISKDGGAAANVTNLPTAITMGNTATWDYSITATEMQAAKVRITVSDAATKAVEDTQFEIDTYGNASAQHAIDLNDAVRAGLTALPNAAAAAAGGLMILGANATATSFTAGLTISNAGGDALVLSSGGSNGSGLAASGNGTGAGVKGTGGATGNGLQMVGGATSGSAIKATGTAGNAHAMELVGQGSASGVSTTGGSTGHGLFAASGTGASGQGIYAISQATNGTGIRGDGAGSGSGFLGVGGATGHGIEADGGATSGDGLRAAASASGHGINATGVGTTKHGLNATGGATTSHGINATGGGTGHGLLATSGAGATGVGIRAIAASTNGQGFRADGTGTGSGMQAVAGATGSGFQANGGGTSGDGLLATVTSGAPIRGDLTGNITGNLTGNLVGTVSTLTTYTGNTVQTGDAYARLGAPAGASTAADIAAINTKTTNLPGSPAAVGSAMTLTSGERTSIADAMLDEANGVETSLTVRQMLRIALAALAGKLSGAATSTVTIRNVGDTKSRIVATVDSDGNRSAVTTDGT